MLELIIVLFVLAVLSGLTAAAVQRAREAANAMRCQNNIKQIGHALHLFHDAYGFFPHSGGFPVGGNKAPTPDIATGSKHWGVGDPRLAGRMQTGPWAYSILPYVEQGNAYRAQTYAISVPVYLCPTRARTNPQFVPPVDALDESPWSGRTYDGAGINPWGKTDYAGNAMVIVGNVNDSRWTGATKAIAEILDGVSNTILVGEKSLDPQAYNTGGWFWDEPIFAGGGAGGTVRSGDFVVRDSKGVTFSDNWGAAHDRGVPFLFGDGAVHWLRFGVSPAVLHVLLNPSDGQPSQIPD